MNLELMSIVTGVTIGLVELVKRIGLSSRFAPLASVLIGIGATALFSHAFTTGVVGIGIVIGLTAAGLYSGVKTTVSSSNTSSNKTS